MIVPGRAHEQLGHREHRRAGGGHQRVQGRRRHRVARRAAHPRHRLCALRHRGPDHQ